MDRFTFQMTRLIFPLILLLTIGCNKKVDKKPEITLTKLEIEELLTEWKKDTMGCLRTRDPLKMRIYGKEIIGKDSLELIELLGQPDFRVGKPAHRQFSYVLDCPKGQRSYFHFDFHFTQDTVERFTNFVQ